MQLNPAHAWGQMEPLRDAGYDLIPLTARRTPWTGWRKEDYSGVDFIAHLGRGGAVGVRLGPHDLVIDVDPRNGGDVSFGCLCFDLDVELDAGHVPAVRTGGGGLHLYYRKPEGRTRVILASMYPGIDFKREGGYVVAPGSRHPSGRTYEWLRPLVSPPQAPAALLALLTRPTPVEQPAGQPGSRPELSPDELALLLSGLDARLYGQGHHDEWVALGMACHAATGGAGFAEWADWCGTDDAYADVTDAALFARWRSFNAGKGITIGTLLKAVADAGRTDLLRKVEKRLDFDAEVERQLAAPIVDNSERRRTAPMRGERG